MADDLSMDNLDPSGSQEPEKPDKKKKKKEGGMSLPVMIGIGFGVIVVNVVLVIVVINFVVPMMNGSHDAEKDKKAKIAEEKKKAEHAVSHSDPEEEEFFENEKERHYMETGRITTNPKMSTKFIVIGLGLEFRVKEDTYKEEELKAESEMMKKMLSRIKAVVIKELGMMSLEDLQTNRPQLDNIFKEKLRPLFKEQKIYLKRADIVEFIVQ